MKRIKQWVNRLSVKKKLILYGYITIAPVLFMVCVFLLFNNYNKVLEERVNNDLSSVNALSDSINVLQMEIKDFSTYICINNEVRSLLTADNVEEKNKDAKLWLEDAPMQIIQDMVALKGSVKTIAIYPENGIRPYLRCMEGSTYVSNLNTIRKSRAYKAASKSDNSMIWESLPKGTGEVYVTNRTDKIVLYRQILDLTQKKVLGYIVIGASQKQFQDLCQNVIKTEKESVIVFDRTGNELCRTGNIDQEVEAYISSKDFIGQHYRKRPSHFTYKDYEVICKQLDSSSSIVCKIVPKYSLQMQIYDIAYMPIILLISMLVALLPLLLVISNLVTKPLGRLSESIRKFSKGDFKQQVLVTTEDEVGEVAICFNKMVTDIKQLIDENYVIKLKERESELSALQAQINPHFLYNTLDSLYWQATDVGNDEIAESILALSELFKLVLNRGSQEVTVAHEVELIKRYLQIQKMRFAKKMNYEINVDDAILKSKIPKLILQPFVENAIVHGFENVNVPCHLTVNGTNEHGFIKFEIIDTGIGMRQDQIDAIWEEEGRQYANQRIGRYAIKNIKERLELMYNSAFRLSIESSVGKGTKVVLMIPFKEEI